MTERVWVALCRMRVENEDMVLLLAEDDNPFKSISAWKSEREALDSFEKGYNDYHSRDAAWSASAVVNWLSYQFSVVEVSGMDELHEHVLAEEPKLVVARNVAGRVVGATTRPGALEYWERGTKPRLIGGVKGLDTPPDLGLKSETGCAEKEDVALLPSEEAL